MDTRRFRTRRGFTLVELLVVIGIIALLISVLMPALGKARQSARTVMCLTNMRQIGNGIRMYANDTKNSLPVGVWANWTPGDHVRWFELINPYIGGRGRTDVETNLGSATNNTISKSLRCPSATLSLLGANHYTSNPIVIPRYNDLLATPALPFLRYTVLRSGSNIVLVMDGVQSTSTGNADAVAFMMDASSPSWGRASPGGISAATRARAIPLDINKEGTGNPPLGLPRWRHVSNRGINVVYADGHAQTHRQGELIEDNFFPPNWRPKPTP